MKEESSVPGAPTLLQFVAASAEIRAISAATVVPPPPEYFKAFMALRETRLTVPIEHLRQWDIFQASSVPRSGAHMPNVGISVSSSLDAYVPAINVNRDYGKSFNSENDNGFYSGNSGGFNTGGDDTAGGGVKETHGRNSRKGGIDCHNGCLP